MTARDGFPPDMNPFTLDAGTAERLVTGAVDVGDAPPQYRAVARLFHALRAEPDSTEVAGRQVTINRIAETVALERRVSSDLRARPRRARVNRIAAASVVSCVLLAGGLAGAGALPNSAQRFASTVLRQVGISVPSGDEEGSEQEPPPATTAPVLTTAPGPVPSMPIDASAEMPSSAPDVASAGPTAGGAPASGNATPTHDAPPDIPTGSAIVSSPEGPSPQNGNGNANATANANANANGHAQKPGNANGHSKDHGSANPPETEAGHGNRNGNGNGKGHAYSVGDGNSPG